MRIIHKYTLYPVTTLEVPEDAQILAVGEQHDDVCLWIEVDTAKPKVLRQFQVFATEREMPEDTPEATYLYLGTALLRQGTLVLHAYEKIRTKR